MGFVFNLGTILIEEVLVLGIRVYIRVREQRKDRHVGLMDRNRSSNDGWYGTRRNLRRR